MDDRFLGYPYRHMWAVAGKPPKDNGTGAIDFLNAEAARYDVVTGKEDRWELGPDSNIQEPTFVPRAPDSPEGDGWLLVLVNRLKQEQCELMLFDALRRLRRTRHTIHFWDTAFFAPQSCYRDLRHQWQTLKPTKQ